MQIRKMRFAVLALFSALVFMGIGAGTVLAVQSHMLNAKHDLQNALSELNLATANKGGYRANAINLTRQAVQQVDLGIQYAQ
jgi:hypothetical protein